MRLINRTDDEWGKPGAGNVEATHLLQNTEDRADAGANGP
ncbi:MAG: hypothetical protein OJF58_001525 [Enhydrobacter sp.]|jgi:hypothetical protein|nr:MAG: hypothetical protein OJF58_001525 [Enhydrobacter sp.]